MSTGGLQKPSGIAFILIDGLGDVTIPSFGQRTPLQAAHTPILDAVAAAGLNGLLDPVEPGLACGSDTAHLSLFGYEPRTYYRGRGAFESMGAGLHMSEGDIAFKCNFATCDAATGIVVKRRADRQFEREGPVLCAHLDGLQLPSYPEHRDNLPLQRAKPADESEEAEFTAALVNELSDQLCTALQAHPLNEERRRLGKSPANCLLLRGCGSRMKVPGFRERQGMRACVVAPTRIIAGLGMCLGMQSVDAPGATGDYRTRLEAKAEAVAQALVSGSFDFAFLHVKAVDDAGHDRLPWLKMKFIEAVDQMVLHLLVRLSQAEQAAEADQRRFTICLASDHSTPVLRGDHSFEPVPLAIAHASDVIDVLGGPDYVATLPLQPIASPVATPGSASEEAHTANLDSML
ncbi:hypothetical protein WJX73_010854 [Symbiochloris irregularis]|uniref:Metalloenzyme domain-containing protein n=1 Tax=Symbiochloris irregularis TaxID=706552 RepID=A0AAW1P375_9CHLO